MPKLRLAFALLALASPAFARDLKTPGHFDGAEHHGTATDMSGIACGHPGSCLVIDNEATFAQWAALDLNEDELRPEQTIELTDDLAAIYGAPPQAGCPDTQQSGPLDGEAVAVSDDTYYVAGSHGCARSDGASPLAAFFVVRIAHARPEASYRLSEAIEQSVDLRPGIGGQPPDGNSIEGMAAIGSRLIFGFRSPKPWLIDINADALFTDSAPLDPRTPILLPLEQGLGVRDLAALDDGRLLVLAGPAGGGDHHFGLYLWDNPVLTFLRTLPSGDKNHPEGLLIVEKSADTAQVVILNDGPKNGDPILVEVPLP